MTRRARVRKEALRFLAAAVVGVAAAVTAYLCAFYQHRNLWYDRFGGHETQQELKYLEEVIEKHRQAGGRLPATLAELKSEKDRSPPPLVDHWKNPFQYRPDGDAFTLFSFGRDGREGGDGRNADIYPPSANRTASRPTLREFALDPESRGVRLTAVLAGVFALLVCVLPPRARNRPEFLARAAASAVVAVVFGVFVAALHAIPSGH